MPKERTLYYRRAAWLTDSDHNLQKYVDVAHSKLKTTAQRTFVYHGGEIQGINYVHRNKDSLLHVTYYVPKQPTSLVPSPAPVPMAETVEAPPPAKHSFMEGDVFLLLRSNNILLCSSGAREGVANFYLNKILSQAGNDESFTLEQVTNVDKVQIIAQEGVKRIRLGSTMFKASADRITRKTKKATLVGALAKEFVRLFGDDEAGDGTALKLYENLQVKVEISFDSRIKGGKLAAEALNHAGAAFVREGDEGFVIETNSGKKLTADDTKVSTKVQLEDHGNSVLCQHAWSELQNYFDELEKTGILEL